MKSIFRSWHWQWGPLSTLCQLARRNKRFLVDPCFKSNNSCRLGAANKFWILGEKSFSLFFCISFAVSLGLIFPLARAFVHFLTVALTDFLPLQLRRGRVIIGGPFFPGKCDSFPFSLRRKKNWGRNILLLPTSAWQLPASLCCTTTTTTRSRFLTSRFCVKTS